MGFWQKLNSTLFDDNAADATQKEVSARMAACVLLLEMAHIDDDFATEEADVLLKILQDEFDLSEDEALQLAEEAEMHRDDSLDLYAFTETLNEKLDKAGRIRIVERLWEIVFSDGRLDGHEDHLIHRLAELLNLEHSELIQAKLKAKAV